MGRIKLFLNFRQPESLDLQGHLQGAGVQFYSLPTSGPTTIWVDGRASHGLAATRRVVNALLAERRETSASSR